MAKFNSLKPIAAGLGFAVAASALTLSTSVNAAQNPFATNDLSAGYQLAEMEGKCGEGKTMKEGNCGGEKAKTMKEGKCGEGKCGENKAKAAKEGKCGEGKTMKEGNCGGEKAKAMKEGKCGEGKCGNKK